jgi:hypothetical protein
MHKLRIVLGFLIHILIIWRKFQFFYICYVETKCMVLSLHTFLMSMGKLFLVGAIQFLRKKITSPSPGTGDIS